MTLKNYIILPILILTTSCSLLPNKKIQIDSRPIQIDIMQPDLPRPVQLTAPKWYVVSEAVITNPCRPSISFDPKKFNDDGTEKLKRPKACDLSERDNPDWPEGYTYLDRFMDEIKKKHGGDLVFVAMTVKDYELMTANTQEIKRYINQLGEVIIYYKEVTTDDTTE